MKKQIPLLFLCILGFCICFILGVLVGRSAVGQHIFMQYLPDAPSDATQSPPPAYIDLNNATLSQLMLLPGIGEATAQRIIDYRESVGTFSCIEDILFVDGIGIKIFEQLKPYITAGG